MRKRPDFQVGPAGKDELLVDGYQRSSSYCIPLAINHLLDIKVEQTSTGLEEAGAKRTTRQEMVAMLIATFDREDVEGLSLEERILHYRTMTVGDLFPDPGEPNH